MVSGTRTFANGSNTDVSCTKSVAIKSVAMTNRKAWAVVVGPVALVAACFKFVSFVLSVSYYFQLN